MDYSLDGKDRAQWDRAWSAMPHRRLITPLKIDVNFASPTNRVVSVTIAEAPGEFVERIWFATEICPVCGATTAAPLRLPAVAYIELADGVSIGHGVWVHHACFTSCPDTGEPAPIPW